MVLNPKEHNVQTHQEHISRNGNQSCPQVLGKQDRREEEARDVLVISLAPELRTPVWALTQDFVPV